MTDMTRAPRDVVPARGLDREALIELNAAVGGYVEVIVPGEVVADLDGIPSAVGPSTVERASIARCVVMAADVERAGLTAEELPNIHVVERN